MSSSIPSFKAALLARLQADAGFAGVQVSWGHPYPSRLQDELIIIGNAGNERQEPVGFPTNAKEEEYSVAMLVSVTGPSRTPQQTLEERAFVLAAVIETSITAWKATAFDAVVAWALAGGMSAKEVISEDGGTREASVSFAISVTARI